MRTSWSASLVGIVLVAVVALLATIGAGYTPKLGLDLQGGASGVLAPKHKVKAGVRNQAISIIRSRADALGGSEPDISRQGDNIVVQLAGAKNQDRALQLV